ncbi:hypothetical protein [Ovoidimarina sediminis]|uniref:hypothetical protein n=1 Tax=Ovoidimarina sediminis TaxID=3079856 RepID=UPI0029133A9B|nr:hypothetical protein [Rhodophyticola sp. MJ-SS7]MDU8942692.1 hypothetical protein [Rhodophyticola sp. MJ-SS7]
MKTLLTLLVAGLLSLPLAASAEVRLLMAEEHGCTWCARWNAEIAHIYPKTPEGRAAPLERFDLHSETPEGVTLASRVRFTPTFILVRDGAELGRIEGYPGEDFFWWLLTKLLDDAEIPLDTTG